MNGFLDVFVCLVDVLEGALLEALRRGIVFLLSDIVVGFVDKFEGPVEMAAPIEASVNCGMIVEIFSAVDGGLFDFVDGFIDFVSGLLFLFTPIRYHRGAADGRARDGDPSERENMQDALSEAAVLRR